MHAARSLPTGWGGLCVSAPGSSEHLAGGREEPQTVRRRCGARLGRGGGISTQQTTSLTDEPAERPGSPLQRRPAGGRHAHGATLSLTGRKCVSEPQGGGLTPPTAAAAPTPQTESPRHRKVGAPGTAGGALGGRPGEGWLGARVTSVYPKGGLLATTRGPLLDPGLGPQDRAHRGSSW